MNGATADLRVNYCNGLSAEGIIDHTDGRHLQWNYLASLPFFDDREGSCELPRSVVERGAHKFRLTRAGPSCSQPAARVFKAHLQLGSASARRLATGPKNADVKAELARLLAPAAQVSPKRLSVTHITSDTPFVAELTVLPSTISEGESLHGTTPTAAQALSQHLRAALATSDLGQQLCGAAGVASTGCNATLTDVFRAESGLTRVASTPTSTSEEESSSSSCATFYGILGGFAVMCIAGAAACLYARSKSQPKSQREVKSQDDVEAPEKENTDIVAEGKPTAQKPKMDPSVVQAPTRSSSFSDNASTATPTDENLDAIEVFSVHTDTSLDKAGSVAPTA
jgi:hypothetical protein